MDVMAWSIYTDLQDHQKGMAVELVLGGTARDLTREVPLAHKTKGVVSTRAMAKDLGNIPALISLFIAYICTSRILMRRTVHAN